MPVVGLTDAIDIDSYRNLTCAVRAGGEVVCWGAGNAANFGRRSIPDVCCASPPCTGTCAVPVSPCNLPTLLGCPEP